MINLRKYKSMTFIIMIFTLIIFTFSIVTSIFISKYKNENQLNILQGNETKYFNFNIPETSDKILNNEVLEVLDKYNDLDIYLEYDPIPKYLDITTLFGKAIYYNYKLDNKLPIMQGRNFTQDDMLSDEKKVLVGKQLQDEITEEEGERYFSLDNEKYKVIGILGNENNETGYDNTFIVNIKSMDFCSDNRAEWRLNTNKSSYSKDIIKELKSLASNKNAAFNEIEKGNKINILEIIKDLGDFTYILKMVFCFGMLNLIIIVYYWMNKNIKEIGIRKAYGATNFDIAVYILKKYELSVVFSMILGVSMHFIFKTILKGMFKNFSFDIYLENILLITIVFMFIGLIVSIIPLIKSRKVKPVNIMKGRLK